MSYVDIMRSLFIKWVQIWVQGNRGEPKNDALRDAATGEESDPESGPAVRGDPGCCPLNPSRFN